jgi:predicted nuclease of predicted toxin-antitoxin system
MKLLFDPNISFRIEKRLSLSFSNSKHISSLKLMNADDIKIWEYAKDNDFTIVTFDSDFYDITLLRGTPPKIIWLQIGNLTTTKIIETLEVKHLIIRDFIENIDKKEIACLEIN